MDFVTQLPVKLDENRRAVKLWAQSKNTSFDKMLNTSFDACSALPYFVFVSESIHLTSSTRLTLDFVSTHWTFGSASTILAIVMASTHI